MKHFIILFLAAMAASTALGRDIKGVVLDETNSPLSFVNVVLYCDSTYVAGGVTGTDGTFCIITDSDCHLTATASMVGYETCTTPVPQAGDVGVITLAPSAVQLGEVVVKASRPATTMRGNALVTAVDGSLLATAGTASDVLVRVPMVVDNGGTLEVFGKGAPTIYINGRKVNDQQELTQLNSHDIKEVEVITNPGSAYAADVKSVIRIRTKAPKGDGLSGTLRSANTVQHHFRTSNSIDLKYRTRGLEVFAHGGWWHGKFRSDKFNEISTLTATSTYAQSLRAFANDSFDGMSGKVGFSWMIDDKNSIGAFYEHSRNHHNLGDGAYQCEVWQDGSLLDRYTSVTDETMNQRPSHTANLYYNGTVGKVGIDFNADYIWNKNTIDYLDAETSELSDDRDVVSHTTGRNRMVAEKLVLSHPVLKGIVQVGEEYTNSRSTNVFAINLEEIDDADNRIDESNMAAFVELSQQWGRWSVGLGLRYEHVKFDYYELGRHIDEQSKTYDNLFPSLNVATQLGKVLMSLTYSGKTVRPGYSQLNGAVSYINRLIYESGNPYLKPTKTQTVEYMAQWSHLFAQLSYSYYENGIYDNSSAYSEDGTAVIVKTSNLPHRHYFQAFAGGQFQVGAWQPKVNVGVIRQWLTLPVGGTPTKMNTPIFLFQWQNAIHLPLDIWLNIDAQLMTRGWDKNMHMTSTPWYVNAKLYKAFLGNTLSVTLEAKDIFDSQNASVNMMSNMVTIAQKNCSPSRSVALTVQYKFNATSNRYRGTGAGNTEKSRF